MSDNSFQDSFHYKVIYVFTINDDAHRGLLKIGDTTVYTDSSLDRLTPQCKELNQAALKRIKEITNTAGLTPVLLWTELAIRTVKKDGAFLVESFRDHQVQAVLKNSRIHPVELGTSREWFELDLETAKKAVEAVKKGYANLSSSDAVIHTPIIFRPEQTECIEKVIKHFKKSDSFLINAKMRFGKTFAALEIVKRCGFQKTIILTHRPVVDAGWYEDFNKIFYEKDYIYGSKGTGWSIEDIFKQNKPFIYFASIQDLRGSATVGGKFNKNNIIFRTVWDCVIVDEAHEGTTTALGEDTVKAVVKHGHGTKFLALSGTPFNILQNYDESSIYTWDYIMEQESKSQWEKLHFGDSNPYSELPQLKIYTYSLADILKNTCYISMEDKAFNFREFFKTDEDGTEFIHKNDVFSFLELLCKENKTSYYPYSNERYRQLFKHALWIVPGVKEARALKKLMMQHRAFGCGQFNIINVAGNGDEEEAPEEALSKVKKAIKESGDNYTITLSCGRLTTGVTVKEWTAVFMLSGSYSTSAMNYLQTIFRVQSPCSINGKIKELSYVFDFAPDRTLRMVSEAAAVSRRAGKSSQGDKQALGIFLNYCPVIAINGSTMEEYSSIRLLQALKNVYAVKAVRNGFDDATIYNDSLFTLDAADIEKFDELKGIIGSSKASAKSNDIIINAQGLTNEEYEESERLERKKKSKQTLSEEEQHRLDELKKLKKVRRDAISILRGISIRMPLLIYGADIDYDVDITLERFIEIIDDSSWDEFMPRGVTKAKFKKFIQYYDEDVFIAAGRKIRDIARNADVLEPEQRIKAIAGLFSYFKNPDKETVLTPWRVVNMHLGDTLGGWNFYDSDYENIKDEPGFIDKGAVTADVFSEQSKILEINSKTGLYPLYAAYSCYKNRLAKHPALNIDEMNLLWNNVIEENIFVVCKTPMAKTITKRTLLGYRKGKVNAHSFDDLIGTISNKPEQFRKRILMGSFWSMGVKEMKFNAVVGNPPYQEEGASTRKAPVYHLFYSVAFNLSDIVSLISPARFLFDAGQTPKSWNTSILEDEHFKVVRYFPDSKDVFDSVEIKGGVVITLRNKNERFGAIHFFNEYQEMNTIIQKVQLQHKKEDDFLSAIVASRGVYRFTDIFFTDYPEAIDKIGKGTGNMIASNAVELLQEVFIDKPANDEYIRILARQNNRRVYKYILKKYIIQTDYIRCYNVAITEGNGTGAFGEVLSSPVILKPNEGASDTFISIGTFKTKNEAEALLKYIKTKFARAMLSVKKATQHTSRNVWVFVPLQDFTSNSDIDWHGSIKEIDNQLYKKYGLLENEINTIESMVKEMA